MRSGHSALPATTVASMPAIWLTGVKTAATRPTYSLGAAPSSSGATAAFIMPMPSGSASRNIITSPAGRGSGNDLGSFEDTTIDSFRTQVDTNFYGVVNVTKAVVPVLREQGSGHIFQVSSLSVRWSAPGLTAYQAAKWAVAGFSIGLAQEIAPFGVQVTVLEPGGMRTDWAGSSMTIPLPSAPYQPTIGAFAELVRAASGHEATNTRRVAQVVRDLAGRDDAPTRILLGTDAVPLAQQAAQELAASDEAWREVSLSVSDRTP